jgi:hypothetical protein
MPKKPFIYPHFVCGLNEKMRITGIIIIYNYINIYLLYYYTMFEFNNIESYPELVGSSLHNYFKEQIIILYYNLTRKNSTDQINKVYIQFNYLLEKLKNNSNTDRSLHIYVETIYKLIAETRDCFYGKGEHDLTYMLIFNFYKYYPVLAIYLIHKLVKPLENKSLGNMGYGSWRDMKYLCQYVREHSKKKEKDPIIEICIEIINNTLKKDQDIVNKLKSDSNIQINFREHISSVAKWIPRENKKFNWLNELLVIHWFNTFQPDFFGKVKDYDGYYLALDKAKMLYRKIIVSLNYDLDTTEIKLCSKNLNNIIIKNVPQLCMNNNNHIFLNENKISNHNCYRNIQSHYFDKFILYQRRNLGIELFKSPTSQAPEQFHTDTNINQCKYIPNIGKLSYFIKEAYNIIHNNDLVDSNYFRISILNHQWKQMSELIGFKTLHSFIPFLDVSFHHDKESLYSGIALAFLISERSSFGNRIMVIDQHPLWINLEDHDTFFSRMTYFNKMIQSYHGTNSNILKGFNLLLDSFIETKIDLDIVSKMSIVFLHGEQAIEYKKVTEFFYKKGIEGLLKKPIPCSRIIFWNLSNKYIDNIFLDKSIYYMSGISPQLIYNLYLLQQNYSMNAYEFICSILNKVYYDNLKIPKDN